MIAWIWNGLTYFLSNSVEDIVGVVAAVFRGVAAQGAFVQALRHEVGFHRGVHGSLVEAVQHFHLEKQKLFIICWLLLFVDSCYLLIVVICWLLLFVDCCYLLIIVICWIIILF